MRKLLSKLCRPDELVCVFLAMLTAVALGTAIESLWWRPMQDSPIMLYIGFLMDQGRLPYRDIFDMNMPATDLIYLWLYRLTNGTHLALRLIDLLCLASITACGWSVMRGFGKYASWGAWVIFPVVYLSLGPTMSLQRETLLLLFLTPMLPVVAKAYEREVPLWQWMLAGGLAGVAIAVKPQASLIGLGMLLWAAVGQRRIGVSTARAMSGLAIWVVSAVLPLLASMVWVWNIGVWDWFVDIVRNYWPLYNSLSGHGKPIQGYERALWDLRGASWFGYEPMVAGVGLVGAYLTFRLKVSPERGRARLLALCMLASVGYLVAGGKFWTYHWLPFFFFGTILAVLVFARQNNARVSRGWAIVLVSAVLIAQGTIPAVTGHDRQNKAEKTGRVAELTRFLKQNLKPGDTVQPLDWTGGAVASMLETKALCSTRFIYDFYFYHDISHAYIKSMRREFLLDLDHSKPRYILQVVGLDKPWTYGPDTSRHWPELNSYLETHYAAVLRDPLRGCVIYERR